MFILNNKLGGLVNWRPTWPRSTLKSSNFAVCAGEF